MVVCVKSPFVVILGQIIVPVGLCTIKNFRGRGGGWGGCSSEWYLNWGGRGHKVFFPKAS